MGEIYTYIGRRVASDDKVKHFWLGAEGGDASLFGNGQKLTPRWARIGQRVEFTQTENGTYVMAGENGPRDAGQIEDRDQVAQWQLQDRSAADSAALASLKRTRKSELDEVIEPLMDFMEKLNFYQRRVFRHYVADRLAGL